MSEIIPFDFEEQAVRVLKRDGEPWFVAADVCRVLELGNTGQAVARLDDDERDSIISNDAIGRQRDMIIVSESGLYALVLGSRKEAARRFRKWITAEVLPAIRKTGRYDHTPPAAQEPGDVFGMTFREVEAFLQLVREARLTKGTKVAAAIWARTPLPPLDAPRATPVIDPAEAQACLDALVGIVAGQDEAALSAMGLRHTEDGLFVGNQCLAFRGTRWTSGLHKAPLMALPGVRIDTAVRSLAGMQMRGIVVPSDLLAMEGM